MIWIQISTCPWSSPVTVYQASLLHWAFMRIKIKKPFTLFVKGQDFHPHVTFIRFPFCAKFEWGICKFLKLLPSFSCLSHFIFLSNSGVPPYFDSTDWTCLITTATNLYFPANYPSKSQLIVSKLGAIIWNFRQLLQLYFLPLPLKIETCVKFLC